MRKIKSILIFMKNIVKGISFFFVRNSKKIALSMLIIAVISLVGMFIAISLVNKEQKNYGVNVYKELKAALNSIETDKGSSEKAKLIIRGVEKKHPELFEIVVTNNAGDILFSSGVNNSEKVSFFKDMKKFKVYSDLGGFNYVFDETNKMKYLVYGEQGKKNLAMLQRYINNNQYFTWSNFLLSSPNNAGQSFAGDRRSWVEDDGNLACGEGDRNIKFLPIPNTDIIIVKPKSDKYYLYACEYSGFRFGDIATGFFSGLYDYGLGSVVEDIVHHGFLYGFSEQEAQFIDKMPILKYQIIREVFLILLILSTVIFWLFLTLWIFSDARKKKLQPLPWTALVLITNIIGLIVYLTVRPKYIKCISCGKEIPKTFASCPYCGSLEKEKCRGCGKVLESEFTHCPSCGRSKSEDENQVGSIQKS